MAQTDWRKVEIMGSQHGEEGQPQWLPWLQLGISTMLVVLFLVILFKVREQAVNIGSLEQKLKTIEATRSPDRTRAMEQQLEVMIQRLQSLEGLGEQLDKLDAKQKDIERDLQQLRRIPSVAAEGVPPQPRSTAVPSATPKAAPSPTPSVFPQLRPPNVPGSPDPSTTLIRPPEGNL